MLAIKEKPRTLSTEERKKFKDKKIIKNLGMWGSDIFSHVLLIEENYYSLEPEKIHENIILNLIKYTVFKKPFKKLIKKQKNTRYYDENSIYHFWEEVCYRYYVKKYTPNSLPINCSSDRIFASKLIIKHNDKVTKFIYHEKEQWKQNLKSYLEMLKMRDNEGKELLTFENSEAKINFKIELKDTGIENIDKCNKCSIFYDVKQLHKITESFGFDHYFTFHKTEEINLCRRCYKKDKCQKKMVLFIIRVLLVIVSCFTIMKICSKDKK